MNRLLNLDCRRWAGVAALVLLAGCASDFVTNPTRPRPTRALESPLGSGSGNNEVMGGPSGAVSLVTVDLPRTKNDPYEVHTIAEPLAQLTAPASRPARGAGSQTQPDETPDAAPGLLTNEIKIAAQQRPDDQFRMTRDNQGNVDLWVLCSTGIGAVTLERTADAWPATIRLHLRYDADREFSRLEGFNASELTAAGGKLALKTNVDKENARAEITIPGFAHSQRIAIEWVDAYR